MVSRIEQVKAEGFVDVTQRLGTKGKAQLPKGSAGVIKLRPGVTLSQIPQSQFESGQFASNLVTNPLTVIVQPQSTFRPTAPTGAFGAPLKPASVRALEAKGVLVPREQVIKTRTKEEKATEKRRKAAQKRGLDITPSRGKIRAQELAAARSFFAEKGGPFAPGVKETELETARGFFAEKGGPLAPTPLFTRKEISDQTSEKPDAFKFLFGEKGTEQQGIPFTGKEGIFERTQETFFGTMKGTSEFGKDLAGEPGRVAGAFAGAGLGGALGIFEATFGTASLSLGAGAEQLTGPFKQKIPLFVSKGFIEKVPGVSFFTDKGIVEFDEKGQAIISEKTIGAAAGLIPDLLLLSQGGIKSIKQFKKSSTGVGTKAKDISKIESALGTPLGKGISTVKPSAKPGLVEGVKEFIRPVGVATETRLDLEARKFIGERKIGFELTKDKLQQKVVTPFLESSIFDPTGIKGIKSGIKSGKQFGQVAIIEFKSGLKQEKILADKKINEIVESTIFDPVGLRGIGIEAEKGKRSIGQFFDISAFELKSGLTAEKGLFDKTVKEGLELTIFDPIGIKGIQDGIKSIKQFKDVGVIEAKSALLFGKSKAKGAIKETFSLENTILDPIGVKGIKSGKQFGQVAIIEFKSGLKQEKILADKKINEIVESTIFDPVGLKGIKIEAEKGRDTLAKFIRGDLLNKRQEKDLLRQINKSLAERTTTTEQIIAKVDKGKVTKGGKTPIQIQEKAKVEEVVSKTKPPTFAFTPRSVILEESFEEVPFFDPLKPKTSLGGLLITQSQVKSAQDSSVKDFTSGSVSEGLKSIEISKVSETQKLTSGESFKLGDDFKLDTRLRLGDDLKLDTRLRLGDTFKLGEKQAFDLAFRAGSKTATDLDLFTRPKPPPKIPFILLFDPKGGIKKSILDESQGFDVFAKSKGKFDQLNKKGPLNRANALSLGSDIVDGSASATFKLKEAKGKTVKPEFGSSPFAFKSGKFRNPIRKGKTIPDQNTFIEKNAFRIDSPGELQQITAKGLLAQKRKRSKTSFFAF